MPSMKLIHHYTLLFMLHFAKVVLRLLDTISLVLGDTVNTINGIKSTYCIYSRKISRGLIIREIFSRVLLHYIIKQGLLAIMALLKYFRFSQGLLLILNATCQAQWDHRRSTVPTKRYLLSLHPISARRIGLRTAHKWSCQPNRRPRLSG